MAENKDGSAKTRPKKPLIYAFMAFVIVFIGVKAYYDSRGNKTDDSGNGGQHSGQNSGQNPSASTPALTADDYVRSQPVAPRLSTYEANDTELNGIKVPAGMNAKMQILGDVPVAFGYYVDGRLVCEWSATGERTGKEITTSGEHTEGYKLKPGQSVRSVKVAYIVYTGPAPKDDSWIALAQAAGESPTP